MVKAARNASVTSTPRAWIDRKDAIGLAWKEEMVGDVRETTARPKAVDKIDERRICMTPARAGA